MADPPSSNALWHWLHRLGYLCTLLVAAEVALVGFMLGTSWWQTREMRAEYRAHSRVHSGDLLSDPSAINAESGAVSRVGSLPSMSALGPDSVRLGVDPSLAVHSYALALRRRGAVAEGLAIVFEHRDGAAEERRAYHFYAPIADFNQVMGQFDLITDGYEGGDRLCVDGTHYAFERRRGARITSGTSMSSWDPTYERAAFALIKFARRFAPVPRSIF